jgi:hypothetical protein
VRRRACPRGRACRRSRQPPRATCRRRSAGVSHVIGQLLLELVNARAKPRQLTGQCRGTRLAGGGRAFGDRRRNHGRLALRRSGESAGDPPRTSGRPSGCGSNPTQLDAHRTTLLGQPLAAPRPRASCHENLPRPRWRTRVQRAVRRTVLPACPFCARKRTISVARRTSASCPRRRRRFDHRPRRISARPLTRCIARAPRARCSAAAPAARSAVVPRTVTRLPALHPDNPQPWAQPLHDEPHRTCRVAGIGVAGRVLEPQPRVPLPVRSGGPRVPVCPRPAPKSECRVPVAQPAGLRARHTDQCAAAIGVTWPGGFIHSSCGSGGRRRAGC